MLPIYASAFVWHIGMSLIAPFASLWLTDDLGEASLFYLAFVLSIPSLVGVFGILCVTHLTDRHGHYRRAIFLANLVGVAQYLGLLLISSSTQYLIVMSVGNLLFPAFYPVLLALATRTCRVEQRGKVNGLLTFAASGGWALGSLFSGRLFRVYGFEFLLAAAAVFFFLAGTTVLKASEPRTTLLSPAPETEKSEISGDEFEPVDDAPNGSLDGSKPSTFLTILLRRDVFFVVLVTAILDFASGAFFFFYSLYLVHRVGFSPDLITYGNAVATVIALAVLWVFSPLSDRIGRKPLLMIGLWGYPVFFCLLSLFHEVWIVFILWSMPMYAFMRPWAFAIISDVTDDQERSRGMSLLTVASVVAMTFGALVGGWAAEHTDVGMDIWTLFPAVVCWIPAIIGYFFIRETLPETSVTKTTTSPPKAGEPTVLHPCCHSCVED